MYRAPEKIIERFNELDSGRWNFLNIWQSVADLMIPFKNDIIKVNAPGESKFNNVYDSTAMSSLEYLAGALHGMLTSPTQYFFGLTTGNFETDQRDDVRLWVQDTIRTLHDIINNSNFQTEVHEYYIDLCGFGNGAIFEEEDIKDVVRFTSWPLKSVVIDENFKGEIDCVYYKYKVTTRAIMDEFSKNPNALIPDKVKQSYDNKKDQEWEIIHAIYPRDLAYGPPSKFPFISQHVFVEGKADILVGGFREFPLIYGRWKKVSGEMYGRGPGETALPDARVINEMAKVTLRAAQKVVDPPLMAPDDGFVMPIITRPAGINYYRAGSNDKIEPLFNGAQIDFGFQAIDSKRQSIRQAFFIDQLQLNQTGPMKTATEVNTLVEQALRFLSPMLGRQQNEFLAPMVERTYGIANRRGLLKQAPPALAGKKLSIVYSSVMAMAQRMSEMQNIQRTFASIAPIMSLDPRAGLNFNADRSVRHIAKISGFPQEMLNTEKERDAIKQQQAQAEANLQAASQQAQNAKALKDVGDATNKTLQATGQAV
jgi:hypothetical protein